MANKFKSTRIYLQPDPIYRDKLVSQFINYVMKKGKKTIAQAIFYDAMQILRKKFANTDVAKKTEDKAGKEEQYELKVFKAAINNVKPLIEVRSRRVGGATYQVPMEIEKKRQITLALRWILAASREKKGKPMAVRLADELSDAYNKQGKSITQRENTHRMAEANKAFAHFAW
ncbi:MAG: 30S ribosomal protein S7 [Candidatus Brocadiae bacterium]|nr:30S ribosomal protein S7 [Candidatus Brocadiia bacterium]